MGVKRLRKIQLGKETNAGTAVAATAVWRGVGTIEDVSETKSANEDIGILPESDRHYIPVVGARLELEETEATFEQLPFLLAMGIKNVVSGSADTGGGATGKIWTYPVAITAAETIKSFTFEGGDDAGFEEFAYGYAEQINLSGAPKQAVMMSASIFGRQTAPTTVTAGLTPATVEEIIFGKGTLAIDEIAGTMGATAKANTLLGFKLSIKTGFVPVFTANGQLYFDFVKQTMPEISLDITFEHDASAVAQIAAWRAKTSKQLQLQFTGSGLATPGGETVKRLTIQLVGHWEKFSKIDEQDGNDIVTGTFKAAYNATPSMKYATITVVNETASI